MMDVEQKIRRLDRVLTIIREEVVRAWTKHPGQFHNAHEGFAVLWEEVDELWDEVKVDTAYTGPGLKEAVQTGAMAARFLVELCDHPKGAPSELRDRITTETTHA